MNEVWKVGNQSPSKIRNYNNGPWAFVLIIPNGPLLLPNPNTNKHQPTIQAQTSNPAQPPINKTLGQTVKPTPIPPSLFIPHLHTCNPYTRVVLCHLPPPLAYPSSHTTPCHLSNLSHTTINASTPPFTFKHSTFPCFPNLDPKPQ